MLLTLNSTPLFGGVTHTTQISFPTSTLEHNVESSIDTVNTVPVHIVISTIFHSSVYSTVYVLHLLQQA